MLHESPTDCASLVVDSVTLVCHKPMKVSRSAPSHHTPTLDVLSHPHARSSIDYKVCFRPSCPCHGAHFPNLAHHAFCDGAFELLNLRLLHHVLKLSKMLKFCETLSWLKYL